MKISLNWLSQYIDLSGLSVDEMSDMLTFAGIEVEDIRQQGVDSPYVVVARVAAAEQHPQADRLKVCQVDVGDGTLHQIVCGAQNYKVGDKVPCALPGAVLEALSGALKEKYPGFQLAGAYSPPFRPWTEEDLKNMREAVASSGANVVWVGLGCPKQERWMAEQRELLPPAVYVGVGAAFAFHAGTVKRAPRWMQKNGLEWLYRIYREPGRLLRRYVKHNSLFVWYVLTGR